MSAVLESLLENESQQSESARAQYRSIVIALANGDDPRLEEVQAVLKATGKNSKQLAADVREVQAVGDAISKLVEAEVNGHERAAIVAKIDTAEAELKKVLEAHRQKIVPYQLRVQDLDQVRIVAASAKTDFVNSYCKNDHRNAAATNAGNDLLIHEVDSLVSRLATIEFEIQKAEADGGNTKRLAAEKAEAVSELNEVKLQILANKVNQNFGKATQ